MKVHSSRYQRHFYGWQDCWGLTIWVLAVLLFATPGYAGTENYDGIRVSVEEPEDITSYTGYAVYRVSVSNRSDTARTIRVTLPADSYSSYGQGNAITGLSATLRVGPGEVASTELLQPPMQMDGSGARVSIDGARQDDRVPVSISSHMDHYQGEPFLISRGVRGPVATGFDAAMTELAEASGGGSYSPSSGLHAAYTSSDRLARLVTSPRPMAEWSDNWLAYTRFTGVLITAQELRQAPAAIDAALRDYVLAGGDLTVVGTGTIAENLPARWLEAWSAPNHKPDESFIYDVGLGRVSVISESQLSNYTASDWEGWVRNRMVQADARSMLQTAEDAERSLPMLQDVSVPTRGLLVLMVSFTLLIGPINIGLLTWFKRRMWLLWTIPLIALVFAGMVLAYSLLSEGIRPRGRTVAVTVLDQITRSAVTVGLTGYYAPLTPGDGLRYDTRTMVAPQEADDYYRYGGYRDSGRDREIDFIQGQHLTRGWVVARVPAHFGIRKVESRRERLDIRRTDGGWSVTNGLGVPIRTLWVVDADGQVYQSQGLPAGNNAMLQSVSEADRGPSFAELRATEALRTRVSVVNQAMNYHTDASRYLYEPNTYIAVLNNASLLEPALDNLREHEIDGVVIGRWREGQ